MLERDALRPKQTGVLPCEAWEAMLAEFMDGALPPADQTGFDQHAGICPACAQLLVEARRGQEWMHFLDEGPESPEGLVEKILLKTQGVAAPGMELAWVDTGAVPSAGSLAGASAVPVLLPRVSPMTIERAFHDARLLMTAAMAFFVIALTLSLFGVRLDTVRAAELKPQTLEATFTREFYENKKQVVSFYDNLRVVYEVESKVKSLRRDAEPDTTPGTAPAPRQGAGDKPAAGARPDGTPSSRFVIAPPAGRIARRHAPGSAPLREVDREQTWRGLPVIASAGACGEEQRLSRHGNRSDENTTSRERSRA